MGFRIHGRNSSVGCFFISLVLYSRLLASKVMENTGMLDQIQVLFKRLTEAERRAKLLHNEVKHIRQEIATIKSEIVSQQDLSENILANAGNAVPLTARARHTILISPLHLPSTSTSTSTSEADGFVETDLPTARKRAKATFTKEDDYVVVYTDGACENNGRNNAKAGIGVWFGDNHPLNISKPVEGKATNNTAEIQACIQALKTIKDQGESKVKLITDSQFTINCITKWMRNWKKNNWKVASGGPVKNKEDLQKLDAIRNCFLDVKWCHVYGHQGNKGNEEADKLAKSGALQYRPC